MTEGLRRRSAGLLFALFFSCATHAQVTVFAAASLKNALDEAAALYPSKTRLSFASSSALARQIENGAPADVFISADLEWMGYLGKKGLLVPGSRRALLGNRLVLIAPSSAPVKLEPAPGFALAAALGNARLAIADPAHVPAGKYAKAALVHLRVWESVEGRIAPMDNVRAALAMVARAEAPLGIVYATDARAQPAVAVAGVFPANSHPPIVYPVAAIKGARAEAGAFLDFLAGAQARRVFEKHGFTVN